MKNFTANSMQHCVLVGDVLIPGGVIKRLSFTEGSIRSIKSSRRWSLLESPVQFTGPHPLSGPSSSMKWDERSSKINGKQFAYLQHLNLDEKMRSYDQVKRR